MTLFLAMVPLAFMYAAPILLAALGGFFSERGGIINIALEGTMMVGAFTAASVTVALEPHALAPVYGLCAGLAAGLLFSVLHALASIQFKADQLVSGTALNLLAGGLTVYLCQVFFDQQRSRAFSKGLAKITVPVLGQWPLIGPLFFKDQYLTTYLALALVLLAWLVVYQTPFGLRLRACGEHPQAAASLGVRVIAMRYGCVLLSGALAGLAGAVMILTQDIQYALESIHGTGFIALACLIFGKWHPFGVLAAGLFFGFSQTLALYAKDITWLHKIPPEGFYLLPYALTLIALVIFSGKSLAPKALGEVYDPGKR